MSAVFREFQFAPWPVYREKRAEFLRTWARRFPQQQAGVDVCPGLLTDFIAAHPLPLTVVRGVRDGTDLEAELRLARFLNELRPGTHLVWIGCEAELQHLSSSAIRELRAESKTPTLWRL
ncbi:MAG: hypothetical protein ACKV19_14040 [Verrucomicrobiales bacterium]